ncbi:hypothetical protein CHU93_13235 [Sandarakinorhabdus cyanobacteriorum]|uniref:Glycine zipper domain-containing protein n=2 Tax=Sandarakinorhabdus cyanobacteriorum TaxID=1981098 RepID=A0A255Y8Z6_9SPHN|nr:hypothetical protein CHU93_13235 [Sandarakinorhabdus cyanobacteriorum]
MIRSTVCPGLPEGTIGFRLGSISPRQAVAMMNRIPSLSAALIALAATPVLAQPAALMRPGQPVVLGSGHAAPAPMMADGGGPPVGGGALYQIYERAAAQGRAQAPAYAPPPPPYGYAPMGYGDGPAPVGANGWRSGAYGDPADGYCRPSSGRGATIGALSGAALGFGLSNRRERGVGTLIGGLVGGLTGAAIERGSNRCR